MRHQPYPPSSQHAPRNAIDYNQDPGQEAVSTAVPPAVPSEGVSTDRAVDIHQTYPSQRASPLHNRQQRQPRSLHERPIITHSVRARIVAALATLKGKRGSPFSFITSGDSPTFSAGSATSNIPNDQPLGQTSTTPPSLKLSWLLRPLRIGTDRETNSSDDQPQAAGVVRMPSYVSSMTLGQTITDPIEGGIISSQASQKLFEYFMFQMNAKWEYILDPYVDNHGDVRHRSSLLFASILFCASKFANYIDRRIVSETDPFLQTRLCSLSRNLVIKSLASGDRSIETMQALYLLACWKDPEDDVSYLHSGYAFGILRDLDLESSDGDRWQVSRCRRTWLALVRQDRQQSLFFVRKASPSQGDEEISFLANPDIWLEMPYALPFDLVAACSADLRRMQLKLRTLVQSASPIMLPCLQELMETELASWRQKWKNHLHGQSRLQPNGSPSLNPGLIHPGDDHLAVLVELWEHSVRLNIASALLRQGLLASVTGPQYANGHPANDIVLDLDLMTFQQMLSPSLPGLNSSIKGAFGTLQNLMKFPPHELRRAPDAIVLLAPSAALFLCLLLCLPPNGILGPAFQAAAVGLVRDIASHIGKCVQSTHDTVTLHSTYLNSLVELLEPTPAEHPYSRPQPAFDVPYIHTNAAGANADDSTLQLAPERVDEIDGRDNLISQADYALRSPGDNDQDLNLQTIVSLLDGDLFWDMLPGVDDTNANVHPTCP